jgi:ribosomal protein S18 acetylase RimI-like enzyme
MTNIIQADLANPTHAKALVFLLNEYAKDPMGGGEPLSLFTQQHLAQKLRERSGTHVILAFTDDDQQTPIGLTICFEGFSSFACQPLLNIHDIVVLAPFRGQGIAGRMLDAAQGIAQKLGCCKLTLEVLQGNTVAQAAYTAKGFEGYALDPSMGGAMFWQKKLP